MIPHSAVCPARGCGRSTAPCRPCAEFLAACAHYAPNGGPVYGGRVLLELMLQGWRLISCGRTAEGADLLREVLVAARLAQPERQAREAHQSATPPPGPSAA